MAQWLSEMALELRLGAPTPLMSSSTTVAPGFTGLWMKVLGVSRSSLGTTVAPTSLVLRSFTPVGYTASPLAGTLSVQHRNGGHRMGMRFGKSVLSQNLRTGCDLALYLTLFRDSDLKSRGLPVPLTARPGIGALRDAGFEREDSIFRALDQGFGERLQGEPPARGSNRWKDRPLEEMLDVTADPPLLLVQPRYGVEDVRDSTLRTLGVAEADLDIMPRFENFIPDLVLVEAPRTELFELSASGERLPLVPGDERRVLSVVDVKHAAQANPSYEAEVVLYGVTLANWLLHRDLQSQYFVNADLSLWTGGGASQAFLQQALDDGVRDSLELLVAVRKELSPVNVPIYVQAVRRFFSEKLPAIIRRGNQDWQALDWYVGPACGSCDWLAHDGWISRSDRGKVKASPHHYCFLRARATDHLSRLPLATRGSCRVLRKEGHNTVADVAGTTGDERVYRQHTVLRAEKGVLPAAARAIATNETSTDPERTDGGLARYADLDIFISVNFDPGAGLLTGLGLRSRFTPYYPFGEREAEPKTRRLTDRWIVPAKSLDAERSVLLAFLQVVASIFEVASDTSPGRGGPHARKTRAQLLFWDRRQFEELCFALGRHLRAILYDRHQERLVKALFWIFPPEELQEVANVDQRRPSIVFVRDVARRLVRAPAVHALTLFGLVEHYQHEKIPCRLPDQFYREPLSDMIPRERIYELWQLSLGGGAGVVRWGGVVKTMSQLLGGLASTVDQQTRALSSLTGRLREDFREQLRARAPRIALTVPTWARGVAADAKLWIAWKQFEDVLGKVQKHNQYLADPDETEAAYEGLRLSRLVRRSTDDEWEYEVSPDSVNSKLRAPHQFLCLSVDAVPGFAALRVRDVVGAVPRHLVHLGSIPMHRIFSVTLSSLDRAGRRAVVRFNNFYGKVASEQRELRELVIAQLGDSGLGQVTLMEGLGSDVQTRRLVRVLRAIGNPPIAVAAPEAKAALGAEQRIARPGEDEPTPAAQVLWEADVLHSSEFRRRSAADGMACAARGRTGLNASQTEAVRQALWRTLTVIWGPPGTGKTLTCQALLHSLVSKAATVDLKRPYTVLVTGPTYRAVGETIGRLAHGLAEDPASVCRLYPVYSRYRDDRFPLPTDTGTHMEVFETFAEEANAHFRQMAVDFIEGSRVVIVAAVAHQCPRIAEELAKVERDGAEALREVFDFVVIDESSQMDMSIAVAPLALLKRCFQVVVVGDHLQMPPIFVGEPPVGAEHLIGSLQNYLIERFDEVVPVPLLENYRSHHDIVAYTRRLGYPTGLNAANRSTRLHLVRPLEDCMASLAEMGLAASDAWTTLLDPAKPIVAVTYPDGMAGQANGFEADCVAALAHLLRSSTSQHLAGRPGEVTHGPWDDETFWKQGLGIVTPHRAQRAQVVQTLLRTFPNCDPELIEGAVDTVERFQGSERHTIIISFGVGDPDVIRGEERFLLQLERTNVAISRAMAKCIVFLSDEVANHIPEDRRAAETAHALRGVVDEWCDRRITSLVRGSDYDPRGITVRWRDPAV
ncbi:MAG: AAA family ATPase [Holophagales bacterium]|nr:AAA family ATPase [Holophagales bacterium]MYG30691.1 AAA family ATPase [Holophagales bacterium]MYI81631.1 AAA family ATPase [Holophagales bacterium]